MMKTCTKCGIEKPLSEFYALRPGVGPHPRANPGHFGECKDCNRARALEWQRTKRAAEPDYGIRVVMRRLYGLELEDYERLLAEQGGGCAICGATEPGGRGKRFHVDHDHSCCPGLRSCGNCIRGLLCHACNTGIGCLGDDVDRLMAAAAYLLARQNVLQAVVF
jgi:Recombination endonuclease VII